MYANKTVNIGTGDNNNPVIALNADSASGYANPYISIGQDPPGFEQDGIFLGFSNQTASFSLLTDGAKANIGGLNVDKKGMYFEDTVVVGQDYIPSTTISSSLYTFPTLITNSGSITVDGETAKDVVSRVGDNEITIDSAIYAVNKQFSIEYMSASFIETLNGPATPSGYQFERNGWRLDGDQTSDTAANESWDVDYEVTKTSITNFGFDSSDHQPVYSVLRLANTRTINSEFGISDGEVNTWKDDASGLYLGQPSSPRVAIPYPERVLSLYLRDTGAGGGVVYGSGSLAYKAFQIIDIINTSDASLTTGYNAFVLGVEQWPNPPQDNTNVFEDYTAGVETNFATLPKSGLSFADPDPNESSAFTQVVWEVPEQVSVNSPSGIVNAGGIGDVTQSIEAFRVHSSDVNAGKPYISLGQLTQSYDEPGIFVGYTSGSDVEQLSLKSFDGTKFLKWTGTDIELSGTIEASDGNIAGLLIQSGSIRDASNRLIISSDGSLTGSGVYISQTVGGTEYEILDTANGIIDAKNNGRNLYFSTDESITTRSSSTGTTAGTAHEIVWQGLEYETRVNVSLQMKVNKSGAGQAVGKVRARLYYMNSGSSTSNDSHYDDWTLLRDKDIASIGTPTTSAYSASLSQVGADSVDSQGKYFEIDDYDEGLNSYTHAQHQTKILKLVLEPEANIITNSGTTIQVYLKNVAVNTGRGLASTFNVGPIPPDYPPAPF